MYRVLTFKTDDALSRQEVSAPGRFLTVLRTEGVSGMVLRIGAMSADPLPVENGAVVRRTTPWEKVWLSADAAPGGVITVVVSDEAGDLLSIDPRLSLSQPSRGTLLESGARTAAVLNLPEFFTPGAKSVLLFLRVTGNPGGAETLSVSLTTPDPVTGNFDNYPATLTTPAATNGNYRLFVGPGLTIANIGVTARTVSIPVNRWRPIVTPSAAGAWTYSLGYEIHR